MWPLIGHHAPVEDDVFKDVWGAQTTVDGLYFEEYKQLVRWAEVYLGGAGGGGWI